jgi:hypothetical protein
VFKPSCSALLKSTCVSEAGNEVNRGVVGFDPSFSGEVSLQLNTRVSAAEKKK